VCPTCREEFPPEAEFCPNDGNRLVPQEGLALGPGGLVCPICGRGFNPGTTSCPEHHEDLIPAAAYTARAATPICTRAVCPLCGAQFEGDHRFCGECGAALVPIN
jgi:predicted amidophosphoribosyltransferase